MMTGMSAARVLTETTKVLQVLSAARGASASKSKADSVIASLNILSSSV
jgi:hypothetical protein